MPVSEALLGVETGTIEAESEANIFQEKPSLITTTEDICAPIFVVLNLVAPP